MKLSKAGYGSVNEVMDWTAKKVITAVEYEDFLGRFEDSFMEINKGDAGT